MASLPRLSAAFCAGLCAWICCAQPAEAKSERTAPGTGLETPDEAIRSRLKSKFQTPVILDAYGNPVIPREAGPRPPRLSPGAYGGYGRPPASRPLPEEKDNRPLW